MTRLRDRLRIAAAFIRIEAVEDLSYPMSVFFQQLNAIMPVLLFYFVSQLFEAEGRTGGATGGDYYSFSIIGLGVAAVLQAALTGFGGRLQAAQDRGTFETLLVEPVPWSFIPVAMNLWRIGLGALSTTLMLTLATLLGADFRLAGVPGFMAIVALGTAATSAVGILSASLMVLAKRSAPVIALYGLAASLFAGTLFPIELIPAWLRWASFLVPHTYVIDVGRQLLMVDPPAATVSVSTAVVGLLTFTAVVSAIGVWLFSRSLQYSRRMGLLSGY